MNNSPQLPSEEDMFDQIMLTVATAWQSRLSKPDNRAFGSE